ncbi:polysaccharide deacetylase family protein [Pseudoroseomonas globiformis]|uniref:Chitooligosaccharide deacetylase n=1 Tax=Teichococcus globiformis TaxID=2307229 RepID=A0ABV7G5X9_9PROT
MLPSHGRYDYHAWPDRPAYSWPGGAKLAVYLGISLQHFSFGEGLGAEICPGPNGGGGPHPDVLNYSWRDYGNRVGAWRLIEMLDALRLPATVLVNSSMYHHAPALVAAHRARGDEIAGHGRTNSERQSSMDETTERNMIREATIALFESEGRRPQGWLSPWIAESRATSDLLAEAGYRYTLNWSADDQPIWLRTRHGPLLAVPYPQEVNDLSSIAVRGDSAEQFAATIVADFEERLLQTRDGKPQVMGIALHPYLIGQPHRLRALRVALEHISQRQGLVWITTAGQIAQHVQTMPGMVP